MIVTKPAAMRYRRAMPELHPLPSTEAIQAIVDPRVVAILRDIGGRGGRGWIVGGFVRDLLLGQTSKDVDVEVYGLDLVELAKTLEPYGKLHDVGRSFGVLRVSDLDVDFSLPRRDSKVGGGHRGIQADVDPLLDPQEATRRRDLTVNGLSLDPLNAELRDPLGGLRDLESGTLRACDAHTFGEDPLRALRVVQLAARLEFEPDAELLDLCAQQPLNELSGERIFEELRKLFLRARAPSIGLRILERTGLLKHFPELDALRGVPQDPSWHPEGDVWVHTCMVVDEAAHLRIGDHASHGTATREQYDHDLALMFGALCHDLGKPATTERGEDGHIRSRAHDTAGVDIAREFLSRLRASNDLLDAVSVLTQNHLAPGLFEKQGATAKAYRRLARRLGRSGVKVELLYRLARADHLGRTTEEALARAFPAGDSFLARARELGVDRETPGDVVLGRHLIARGLEPGPEFRAILGRCRELQDETGSRDVEWLLDSALEQRD